MWTRPDAEVLEPSRTALVVFDLLECYRSTIEGSEALARAQQLIGTARAAGILVCFARAAHREDGADYTRVVADLDPDFRPWTDGDPQPVAPGPARDYRSLAELGQRPEDIDVPKHRWSAFHGTALDLTLRVQGIDTVIICGGSTHVGVASTVYAGRDLDYQMIVARDACTGHAEPAAYFCDTIFPRMVRVRTVAQISAMTDPNRRTTA